MKSRIVRLANEELYAAAQWYEDRQSTLGDDFIDAVLDAIDEIERHPVRFPRVPKIRSTREFRQYLLSRLPYHVVYEIAENKLAIIAIAHAKRRPGCWRNRA